MPALDRLDLSARLLLPAILIAPLAVFSVACGGDEPGEPNDVSGDAGTDIVADGSGNGGPDTSTDAGVDAGADTPIAADPPVLNQIRPTDGPLAGRRSVAILGSNFVGPCSVQFGDQASATVTIINDGGLDVSVPAADQPGAVDVVVTCAGGTATLEGAFTYLADSVASVFEWGPLVGHVDGGELITFTGENFTEDERTAVRFGGDFANEVQVTDGESIRCLTPASPAGPASVSIELADQRLDLDESFVFINPLTVDLVEPFAGDRAGGSIITLTGTNLVEFAQIEIRLGESLVDPATYVFDDEGLTLVVEAPASEERGLVDVHVTALLAELLLEDAFAYVDPIVVSSMDQVAVPTTGVNRVTIIGEGFSSDAEPLTVFVGEDEAFDVSWDSETAVSFLVPPLDPGSYSVELHHGFEIALVPDELNVFGPIRVDNIDPTSGPDAGGTRVDIEGAGFVDGVIVRFGDALGVDVAVAGDGLSLSVTTPEAPDGPGDVDVVVRSPFSSGSVSAGFTFEAGE